MRLGDLSDWKIQRVWQHFESHLAGRNTLKTQAVIIIINITVVKYLDKVYFHSVISD